MREIKIYHSPHFDGNPTPARCKQRTGEIWINDSVWGRIKPEHRVFILLHERGHIELQSSDELAVDHWAMNEYIKLGYSLTDSVKALSRVLTGKSPAHINRVRQQLNRAKRIDNLNPEKSMCRNSNTLLKTNDCDCEGCTHNFTGNESAWYDYESFDGCDASKLKPRQYRKCIRTTGKATAKINKSEGTKALKEGKGQAAQVKAEAKRILADQGIVDQSGLSGVVRAAGEAFKGAPEQSAGGGDSGGGTSKILMWVGIGVGVIAVIGTIIFLIKRK